MPTNSVRRLVAVMALAGACMSGCGSPKKESPKELLERALSDTTLDDTRALMLIGQASFRGFKEAAMLPPVKDKIMSTVIVQGKDTSTLQGLMQETDPKAIQRKLKEIQFIMLFKDLDSFIENGRKKNLGDLSLVLQVPTQPEPGPDDWADAYKLKLAAKSFDRYLNTAEMKPAERLSQAERLWKVELDRFK